MAEGLTELEGCVLGLIWERGPCTTYSVRKVFQASPNPYWSGSAGAIYPLVTRLKDRKLLASSEGFAGKRRHEHFRITSKGLRALKKWIGPHVANMSVGLPMDRLRTRVQFLGALDDEDRKLFIDSARSELQRHLDDAIKKYKSHNKSDEPYEYLIARGVAIASRARLKWFDEVEKLLS